METKRLNLLLALFFSCIQISCSKSPKELDRQFSQNLPNNHEAAEFSIQIAPEVESELNKQIREGSKNISKPLNVLPSQVKSLDQQLTFFADYDHKAKVEGSDEHPILGRGWDVPIYIVNRTDEELYLLHGGKLTLLLEYEVTPGKWARAEVNRTSGNMCPPPRLILAPYSFFILDGYLPKTGEQRKIRYTLFEHRFKVSTNVGLGPVNQTSILLAKYDLMSIRKADFEFLCKIALNEIEDDSRYNLFRSHAIERLKDGNFDPEKTKKILERIGDKTNDTIKPK